MTYPYGDGTPCLQYQSCDLENARKALAKMNDMLSGSGLGKRFNNRVFETFDRSLNPGAYDAAKKYAEAFTKQTQDGLLFMGYVGVGKTHLAAAILHEVIKRGVQPIFIEASTLALKLSTSWQEGDTRSLANEVQKADVLIIDDLGKEKNSDTITTFLFQTINSRYEDCKPTIITTNLTRDEIKQRYEEAIYSRLMEMCRGRGDEGRGL